MGGRSFCGEGMYVSACLCCTAVVLDRVLEMEEVLVVACWGRSACVSGGDEMVEFVNERIGMQCT